MIWVGVEVRVGVGIVAEIYLLDSGLVGFGRLGYGTNLGMGILGLSIVIGLRLG